MSIMMESQKKDSTFRLHNVLSLFDGISCGQMALNNVGIEYDTYFSSEIDKYAIKVTQANYPKTVQLGDVTKVIGASLPKIDLLIGGSPCQGFSLIGKRLNFEDPRSKLFFEYLRLLKECKPKFFLLENVLMKKEFQDIISKELGVEPILINSSLVSAQNRKRLYWTNIPNITQPEDRNICFRDIRDESKTRPVGAWVYLNWGGVARINKLKTLETQKLNCLTTSKTHTAMYYLTPCKTEYRNLTINEARKAQTIPESFNMSMIPEGKQFHALGNGWTVDVISHIFKSMLISDTDL